MALQCPTCRGIWLDPGELERIQVYYEAVNQAVLEVDSSFKCPKCGVAQVSSDECSNCGIIFSKYQAGQNVDIDRGSGKIDISSECVLVRDWMRNKRNFRSAP